MAKQFKPPVIDPLGVAEISSTGYPSPYKEQVAGRSKRKLGDAADYSDIDMIVRAIDGVDRYLHKDGTPY